MERLEKVEREVQSFPPEELAALRQWFAEFDAEAWDGQFKTDVKAGKLDTLAERALRDHSAGNSKKL
jgi:hypothetical protein